MLLVDVVLFSTFLINAFLINDRKMDGEDDEESACPICFESFDEKGDNIPRLLPCGGVICEKCIAELIADNVIECPECGSDHTAEGGIQSFPERSSSHADGATDASNEPSPQSQEEEKEEEVTDETRCKEHGVNPSIYCKESYCQKAVLLLQTQEQDIVDAEDEQFDTLFSSLESATKLLTCLKTKIVNAKEEIDKKNTTCLEKLKSKQEEMVKALPREEEISNLLRERFNELTKGASDQMARLNTNIDNEVTAIDEHLNMLDSIKETTHTTSITRTDITKELETIRSIEAQVKSNVSDTLTLKYLEYHERPVAAEGLAGLCAQLKKKDFCEKLSIAEDVESLCGYLRQRETCVHLVQEAEDDDVIVVDVQIAKKGPEDRPRQQGTSFLSGI